MTKAMFSDGSMSVNIRWACKTNVQNLIFASS